MAREASPREDLLKEATGLVRRAEYQIPGFPGSVVIGFRKVGAMSLFLDQDPVYQFNTQGELRRAFVDGLLFKSEDGKLISMRRERPAGESNLVSQTLAEPAQTAFIQSATARLKQIETALSTQEFQLIGKVTDSTEVHEDFLDWMQQHGQEIVVAQRPNVVAAS
ncbi:MAG: hypothetical protein COA78_04370 [Blastopirellula sp.]|nr:MAG: hypothetical protein COA78_04370 [Blastopirellula sp.]